MLNNYLRAPGIMFGMGMLWRDSFHIPSFYVLSFIAIFWNVNILIMILSKIIFGRYSIRYC